MSDPSFAFVASDTEAAHAATQRLRARYPTVAPEQAEKARAVCVVEVDGLAGVAARGHVVDGAGKLQAERAGHGQIVASVMYKVKC